MTVNNAKVLVSVQHTVDHAPFTLFSLTKQGYSFEWESKCPSFTQVFQITTSYTTVTELVWILTFERQRQDRARLSVNLILLADVLRRQSCGVGVGVRNWPTP